jgi:hypothetical protein
MEFIVLSSSEKIRQERNKKETVPERKLLWQDNQAFISRICQKCTKWHDQWMALEVECTGVGVFGSPFKP